MFDEDFRKIEVMCHLSTKDGLNSSWVCDILMCSYNLYMDMDIMGDEIIFLGRVGI